MLNLLFLASSEFIEADSSGVTWGVPPPHYVIMNQAATREACMCFVSYYIKYYLGILLYWYISI